MLLPFFFGQGTAPTGVSVADLVDQLVVMLSLGRIEDLTLATEADVYTWADEAVEELARNAMLFVVRDDTLTITAADATFAVPARWISAIHVSQDNDEPNADWRALIPASVPELEARDTTWETAAGTPTHFALDQLGLAEIRVHKIPAANTSAAVVYVEYPSTIAKATPTLTAPKTLGVYLFYRMLAIARGKQSDEPMPEVAAHARGMSELLGQVFQEYWGVAQ